MAVQINIAAGVENSGLAMMMADIIKGNLKEKPFREKLLNGLKGNIYLVAEDAEVDMTMAFETDCLTVHCGKVGTPKVVIRTDSMALLDLANIRIKFGLPYYFDKVGRSVIKKLLTGQLKLKGLLTHPFMVTRFTILMSVQ